VTSLGLVWDGRDDVNRPAKGSMIQAAAWIFRPTTDGVPAFTRTALDARAFRRAFHPRHIVAARVLASMDHRAGGVPVPFHLQQTLGGSSTLRSFHSFRVRGERLAALLLESQWQAHKMLDVVVFTDFGVVGRTPLPHDTDGMLTSVGVGARGRMKDRILVRTELAFGRDGTRFVFAMDSPF
jgi:outer membrane protein assembly factor BamA